MPPRRTPEQRVLLTPPPPFPPPSSLLPSHPPSNRPYLATNFFSSLPSRLILTYLIPCHLLTTHTLPSATLLRPYPRLHTLFTPLSNCIRKGDLAGFDAALAAGENEFVKRRIYLTLERGRDIALRNLFRKVFVAGGWEGSKDGVGEGKSGGVGGGGGERIRRTRVPLIEFIAAIRLGSGVRTIDGDEVECLLANMIYKVSLSLSLSFFLFFFSPFLLVAVNYFVAYFPPYISIPHLGSPSLWPPQKMAA